MCHLQELYAKYQAKGLVILGFNASDDKKIALEMLIENRVTFPNILDSSDAARRVCFQQYQGAYGSAVPMNYIIDREGKVVDAWYGGGRVHPQAIAAIQKVGGELAEAMRGEAKSGTAGAASELARAAGLLFQVCRAKVLEVLRSSGSEEPKPKATPQKPKGDGAEAAKERTKQPASRDTEKKTAPTPEDSKGAAAKGAKTAAAPFKDEPAAHALYDQMIATMRKAKSLSYVSRYEMQGRGGFKIGCTYRTWLKKPNYFRVEAERPASLVEALFKASGGGSGVLIGDGNTLWIYWPKGRFQYGPEDQAAYEKTRLTSYMTKRAPLGGHSIGHETGWLGAGMSMPIIDPSTFHGYTDSLQAYLDGVQGLGAEKVGEEECDKIEVSIMKHQRSWYLWLSKRDHLPRKLKEIVRVSYDLVITEEWSSVAIDADIPDKMFAWKPPAGWTEWKKPPIEAGLLKPGAKAPDFELASAEGKRIKLSDFRGRVVWFYIWRAG